MQLLAHLAFVVFAQFLNAANIVDTANANGLTTLLSLVVKADLADDLTNGESPLTVLAPTNAAFSALPKVALDLLAQEYNNDLLTEILLYHVFGARYDSSVVGSLVGSNTPPTLQGSTIAVTRVNGVLTLNGNSKVIAANVAFENGAQPSIVHVIDAVLVPPAPFALPTKTITELVVFLDSQGQFKTLLKLILEFGTELTTLLSSYTEKGFTVFAPVDSAFAKLPKKYRTFPLRGREKRQVKEILLYHVLPNYFNSAQLAANGKKGYGTASGRFVRVRPRKDGVFVQHAKVITADVRASNGIIHSISSVLDCNK